MSVDIERNREYEDSINTDKRAYLESFVSELGEELDTIGLTLDTESSKMLLNWVRNTVHNLQKDFNNN